MDPKIINCKLQGPGSQGNGGGHEPCQFNEKVDHNEVLSLPDTPSLKSVIASWGGAVFAATKRKYKQVEVRCR
jgi:hypothetical protein